MATALEDWSDWLNEHGPAMVLFAQQWATSRSDAEDIVQEAFVRFWRSREKAVDPAAYLYTCTKRVALEWLRGRERRERREERASRLEGQALFDCPVEHEERRVAIEAAIAELPESQREVLVLKIWGGLSFPQISGALSVSANTVASRFRYALAKLRKELAEEKIR